MPQERRRLVVVGGGPAGMMAGALFARAGVETVVLEKHGDFLRDFRGDTVHPSTLGIVRELGWIDEFLRRPHQKVDRISATIAGVEVPVGDFGWLAVPDRFIAMMPQWDFLDFVADKAREFPAFTLRMNAEAVEATFDAGGRASGVVLASGERIPADLVIAADGRRSIMRESAALPLEDLGAPIDVAWFRLSKPATDDNRTGGVFAPGRLLVRIDRGDYWQAALVLPKGTFGDLQEKGLDSFRADIATIMPDLADAVGELRDWDQVKLLVVSLDRLTRWWRPGLLAIGDAAHAMSPVGGVGINLAIQDAVAAANILADPMAKGYPVDGYLRAVERRRMLPTRVIQRGQRLIHDRILGAVLASDAQFDRVPAPLRLLQRCPRARAIPAWLVGLGFRREHVRSPEA